MLAGRPPAPVVLLVAVAATVAVEPRAQDPPTAADPVPSSLVEKTTSRLAQVDVTVRGPRELVSALEREDFRLKVHMRWLEAFEVDRYCTPPPDGPVAAWQTGLRPAISYVFYFDQPHLTLGGRARVMDVARDLVDRLVTDGNQAMIVSNARRLVVIEEFTDDPQRLLTAIDRLEGDRTQWDVYASEEDSRVARVIDYLNHMENVQGAVGMAKTYQREEQATAERSLRRLHITLARLSELESRKAVLYLGDTIRQNPGEHYLTFFGNAIQRGDRSLGDIASEAFMAGNVFDKVVNEAATHGIRFYPVYAQGLVTPFDQEHVDARTLTLTGSVPSSSRARFRDSQNTLANMATETGGRVFLRGQSPAKIAEQVLGDFSCLYTLSFDPGDLPQDDPLRVIVRVETDGVEPQTAGRIVLQSEAARRSARLLSAFALGKGDDTELSLAANLVPIGFDDGAYAALLQISVPGSGIPAASWELGASLIDRDRVLDEVSGTLAVRRSGVPLVLEHEVRLRPGPHEIVAVAHEATTDYVLSEHVQVAWPDPNRQPVTCGPLALLQPTAGAFVRSGNTRIEGSLARSEGRPVSTDLPTALMGLVCHGRRHKGLLRVERTLIGASAVEFPFLEFELGRERCAQVRDLIPAGSLGPGTYRYLMRVVHDGEVLHEAAREFVAAGPES